MIFDGRYGKGDNFVRPASDLREFPIIQARDPKSPTVPNLFGRGVGPTCLFGSATDFQAHLHLSLSLSLFCFCALSGRLAFACLA